MLKQYDKKPKLLIQCVNKMRLLRKSYSTEKSYVSWIKRFIHFHNLKHPIEMDETHVEEFLTDLAVMKHVTASTQNQALNAIIFLYKDVLEKELKGINALRAGKSNYLPVVLTVEEVAKVVNTMSGLSLSTVCTRKKVPEGTLRVEMAIHIYVFSTIYGSKIGHQTPPSYTSRKSSERRQTSRSTCDDRQTCRLPFV